MSVLRRLKKARLDCYWCFFRHLPLDKNKILLWSDSFKSYGCSPKYIAEHLLKNHPGEYDLVWVIDADRPVPEDIPAGIRVVRYFSIDYLREISTAKFVICNSRTGAAHYFNKRQGQVYIQTWHSSLRLKKIEGDAEDTLGQRYIDSAKADSEKIDLLLSGCRFSTEIFKRAFWYDGEILESGTPRCDLFFGDTKAIREKVYARYGLDPQSKLVLYAPTFRDAKQADTHGMDFALLKETLEQSWGGNWTIGCRLHPNIQSDIVQTGVVSLSRYPDMQELIAAADLLITDYSSCMFDMAVAGKPCLLFAPDLERYMSKERGLYFDIRELPFPLALNMEELQEKLRLFDRTAYQRNVEKFMVQTGSYEDGHAAGRVAEYIRKVK